MAYVTNHLINSSETETNLDPQDQVDDLKGQLNATNLRLKDNEFNANRNKENFELKISKLQDEKKILKDKFEKVSDAQRKLETQNSKLEDRLLKIVEKYESEQKDLFEELRIAHSKLVELKLTISNLEEEKESFRKDCNVAVNLLQCKPGDFINHSYNQLPSNLKDRLKPLLTEKEVTDLQDTTENESTSNSLFKLPVFQPSAAAAMMYNMQNVSVQRELQRQQNIENTINNLSIHNDYVENVNETGKYFNDENVAKSHPNLNLNSNIESQNKSGLVSSSLIAQVLKKDTEAPSKMSYKLLPYICLRCKIQTVICNQSSQTDPNDLLSDDHKILTGNPMNKYFHRAKTVGNDMSRLNENKSKKGSEIGGIILL